MEKGGGQIGLKNWVNKMGEKIVCQNCVEKLFEKFL